VGVYGSFEKAKDAVQALERSAFPSDQISLATHSVGEEIKSSAALQYGDQSESDAVKGASVGGLVGVLLASPLLAIPGVGPLLVAGPLAAAGLTGAVVGGLLGSMQGWGVHSDHIAEYEELLRKGKLLVVAHGNPEEVALAESLLDDTDAESLTLHMPTSADWPTIDDT
jgi:uncharacterized membrane protein